MTKDSTPRHDLTPEELEAYLRDSHVAIKETLRARGELEAGDEAAAPSPPPGSPPRLRLVTRDAEDDTPDADQAKLVELRARGRGLVDAERMVSGDGSEAKFHRRHMIAQAVRAARDSRSAPAVAVPRRAPSMLRMVLWIVGAVAVAASVVFGLALALQPSSPGPASPDEAAPVLPLPLSAVRLDLRGVPEGATIRLDGTPVQGTTVAVDADGEAHTLSVEAAGYRRWSVTVTPAADQTIPVDLMAQPATGARR